MKKFPVTMQDLLSDQVEEVLPNKKGLEDLMKKKKIRVYFGIDPTGTDLHLGHAVPLRKLRQFQDLGHEVILLFGTFTGLIGDPSGKDKARIPLSLKEVRKNMASYKKQAGKILDLSGIKIKNNGDWLSKLKSEEFLKISSYFTTSQLLERDMFQKRLKKGEEVWVNELLYPLMQGYDSVAMDVDLEIGATDQTFNMLIGRRLQKLYNKREKFILTTPLLLGLDGRKMSKTYGNTVNILDTPQEMYGKLMSMKDELILHYFELCTDVPIKEVERLKPREAKARLAKEVVTLYYGKKAGEDSEQEFIRVFRNKEAPSRVLKVDIKEKVSLVDFLVRFDFAGSKSEARRLIEQKGVRVNGKVQEDPAEPIRPGMRIQVGKRKFIDT